MRSDWLRGSKRRGRISPLSNYEQLNSRMFSLKQHNTRKNRRSIIMKRRGRISPYSNYEELNSFRNLLENG